MDGLASDKRDWQCSAPVSTASSQQKRRSFFKFSTGVYVSVDSLCL